MGFAEDLELQGWAWSDPLPESVLQKLERAMEGEDPLRRARAVAPLEEALEGTGLQEAVRRIQGNGSRIRRAFLMDKREGDNWELAFHQDTTLAVQEPGSVPGFHAWVHKGDWYHVQAPASVMGRVLSTRIHLDPVDEWGGALKVLPGTHRDGILDDAQRMARIGTVDPVHLTATRGNVLFMSPLVLHGSERARNPSRRRVLHVEWAAFDLPGGLRWAWF